MEGDIDNYIAKIHRFPTTDKSNSNIRELKRIIIGGMKNVKKHFKQIKKESKLLEISNYTRPQNIEWNTND